MLLTKHEGVTFQNLTIYISGQAFVRCHFVGCTLVLRETVYYLEGCTFERCNWHVDWVLMWGSPESIREIKSLVNLIEQAQATQLPTEQAMQTQPTARSIAPFPIPPPGPATPRIPMPSRVAPPSSIPAAPFVPPASLAIPAAPAVKVPAEAKSSEGGKAKSAGSESSSTKGSPGDAPAPAKPSAKK